MPLRWRYSFCRLYEVSPPKWNASASGSRVRLASCANLTRMSRWGADSLPLLYIDGHIFLQVDDDELIFALYLYLWYCIVHDSNLIDLPLSTTKRNKLFVSVYILLLLICTKLTPIVSLMFCILSVWHYHTTCRARTSIIVVETNSIMKSNWNSSPLCNLVCFLLVEMAPTANVLILP